MNLIQSTTTKDMLKPIGKESNRVMQIKFMGGAFAPVKDEIESEIESGLDSDLGLSFSFTMTTGNLLEPVYFVKNEKSLSKKQSENLRFL